MSKKRKIDGVLLTFTIITLLITIIPIIVIAYLCISNQVGWCTEYINGDPISVRCSEVISTWGVISKYKEALIVTLFGTLFIMPIALLGFQKYPRRDKQINGNIIVIILYIVSWFLAIYVTSSFWISLGMLFMHHLFGIGAIYDLALFIKNKISVPGYQDSETIAKIVKSEKEKLNKKQR